MPEKTAVLFFLVALLGAASLVWIFFLLFQRSRIKPSGEDQQASRDQVSSVIGDPEHPQAIMIGSAVLEKRIRIVPFQFLPSLEFAPHRIASLVGMAGTVATLAALAWCLFVPRIVVSDPAELGTQGPPPPAEDATANPPE